MEKPPYLRFVLPSARPGKALSAKEVVDALREPIVSEPALAGCRLPPVRVLAHQLGLSKNTIQRAYDELKSQGLVDSKRRSGLFVANGTDRKPPKVPLKVPEPRFAAGSALPARTAGTTGRIELSSVYVDPQLLPIDKLAACFRSVLKSPGLPAFSNPRGNPLLRRVIAERLQHRGMDVDPEHVILTNGSQQGLDMVTRALSVKRIATENPAYSIGRSLFEVNGIDAIGLPIDPFSGIDRGRWQQRLQEYRPALVYVTSNFQNPTGYSYSTRELEAIVHWAREFGFGILEDDWGSDMLSY
ncbi:MAG: PLP-dependent aminotransferase family protein, partial [Myxococcota bacterium]